jgi:hypothetical protein
MATRRRSRSKLPRTPPRRAPARPKLIVPEPLRDTQPLTETLRYQYIGAVTTIVQDSVRVDSKRSARSQLTDEDWAKHLRLHPFDERDPTTGQPLGARARKRKLKEDQGIIVSLSTVRRRLKSARS